MDALTTAAFEERAASAEARLAALEAKLSAGGSTGSTEELKGLRALLVAARDQAAKLQEERDQAVGRVASLEDENGRLKYQVMHLKRAVKEGDEKLARKA